VYPAGYTTDYKRIASLCYNTYPHITTPFLMPVFPY
jgi:hypothetical protein